MSDLATLDDAELIDLWRMGNGSAISELVRRYNARLVRLAVSLTRDLDAAKDVVQDVWTKIVSRDDLTITGNFASLLGKMVRFGTLDRFRDAKRRRDISDGVSISGIQSADDYVPPLMHMRGKSVQKTACGRVATDDNVTSDPKKCSCGVGACKDEREHVRRWHAELASRGMLPEAYKEISHE